LARCHGTKPDGTPCERIVSTSQEYCFAHDPSKVEARRKAASKGGKRAGRARPMAELADLKAQLSDLYTSVLTDMIEPKTGAVLAQITNAQIRITEVELKVREQQELEVCLEELEEVLEAKKGSNQWGA
jgi:CRISPR/Cas system-associated exonuclease Cas4 (RecB family)